MSAFGAVETVGEVRLEGRLRQATDRHLPGTSPERLVPVVEQRLEHVALAAEVGVTDLGLGLEHGPHPVRQGLVEPHHLLELVEHEHCPSLSLRPELAGQLQQPVDRVVDVLPTSARGEGEADVALERVDLDRRLHPQRADERRRSLDQLAGRGGEIVEDRLRERGRKALLRRRSHQVAVRDENLLALGILDRAEGERRLPEPSGRQDDDVLPAPEVGDELRELALPVDERVVESEGAEGEGVGGIHACIMQSRITVSILPCMIRSSIRKDCRHLL